MSDLITLRKKKSSKFYSVDLRIIENSNLSWGAKGVWTYLISRPDGWAVNRSDLLGKSKDGDTALRAILKELTEAGLLKIERVKVKGKFGPTVWIVSEDYDLSDVENPHVEKPCVEKPHVVNPQAEKPHVENPHDLESTSITNYLLTNYQDTKDQINTPFNPPMGETSEIKQISLLPVLVEQKTVTPKTKRSVKDYTPDFDRFWELYPEKESKAGAFAAWKKLNPNQDLQDTILKDVALRIENDPRWLDKYIPFPARYLKEKRWESPIKPASQKPKAHLSKHERNQAVLDEYFAKKGIKTNGLT